MLTADKHVAEDNYVFQQDSALTHHACNTVKLLESALSALLLFIIALPLTAEQ